MPMKLRSLVQISLAVCCAAAFAQDNPPDSQTTTYNTAQGPLIVHSGQPAARDFGPAPAFAQLDRRGAGYVTADEADAYPPLANDFIHADANRDGRVTRVEYERWLRSSR
jgi:hypothetical protein